MTTFAVGITDQIEDHNGIVIGPATTLVSGIDMLHRERPDACILNIRLGPDMVYPLADELLLRGIPFIFASGETRDCISDRFAGVPLFSKPIDIVIAAASLLADDDEGEEQDASA